MIRNVSEFGECNFKARPDSFFSFHENSSGLFLTKNIVLPLKEYEVCFWFCLNSSILSRRNNSKIVGGRGKFDSHIGNIRSLVKFSDVSTQEGFTFIYLII